MTFEGFSWVSMTGSGSQKSLNPKPEPMRYFFFGSAKVKEVVRTATQFLQLLALQLRLFRALSCKIWSSLLLYDSNDNNSSNNSNNSNGNNHHCIDSNNSSNSRNRNITIIVVITVVYFLLPALHT